MPVIKPTVGRVVWYTPYEEDFKGPGAISRPYSGQKCVAFITSVHGDRMINVYVLDPNGKPFTVWSCSLVQLGDAIPEGGRYCEWMPYQTGQAMKTEALEKQLAGGAKES
jgi:hypothetical protein